MTSDNKAIVNKSALAAFTGYSFETISHWVKRGCPVYRQGRKGLETLFYMPDVWRWRAEDERRQIELDTKPKDYDGAVQRKVIAEAELKEMELAERRQELVSLDQVTKDMEKVFMSLRSRLLSIPIKAAPLLVACRNESELQQVLTKQVDEALHELSNLPFIEDEKVSVGSEVAGASSEIDREPVGGPEPDSKPRKQRRAGRVAH